MAHAVVALTILNEEMSRNRVVQLESGDGYPVRVTSWSIESDWLYVVYTGQRRAYRLYPSDYGIEEVLLASKEPQPRIIT